jgi:hypothetical protein
MKHKPGYRSSEFWFTVVSFIFSGLYLIGAIGDSSYKDELIRDVSHAVESTILIGGQLLILYRYVQGRNEIKKIEEEENLETIKNNSRKTTPRKTTPRKTPSQTTKKPKTKIKSTTKSKPSK